MLRSDIKNIVQYLTCFIILVQPLIRNVTFDFFLCFISTWVNIANPFKPCMSDIMKYYNYADQLDENSGFNHPKLDSIVFSIELN